jgi:hypothetical protein
MVLWNSVLLAKDILAVAFESSNPNALIAKPALFEISLMNRSLLLLLLFCNNHLPDFLCLFARDLLRGFVFSF